jgi:AmmeMemoRadiSam system protein B
MVDTVGFAHLGWQVDSVVNRISRTFPNELAAAKISPGTAWRVAISPHDDYTYASWQYPALLKNIKAKTVIIFGVAHKARQLNISDKIVFDSFPWWHGPYQSIKVSSFREELMGALPKELYLVSDSLQRIEHSVESMLPILQHFNREVEIVSILVPFMNAGKMAEISRPLASAIAKTMKARRLEWGKDVALLITTDAVHYGDEDWGGKNMAPFGADSAGYVKAVAKEHLIIDSCLVGEPSSEKIRKFIGITVKPDDYKEYQWTWCGRYSLPLGLMVALELQKETNGPPLNGRYIGYTTSIDHQPLPVGDLRMGKTANATIRHWVGYASVAYE